MASKNSLALYPDSSHYELKSAIAEVNKINIEKIVCGAGSDELIHLLCQCYAGSGDEVIHTEHGFHPQITICSYLEFSIHHTL